MRSVAVRLGAVLFILSLLPTQLSAVGAGTQINFAVCGEGSGSSVTIESPQSDSVGNSPDVTLSGSIKNATQIDVSVDGSYSHTEVLNVTDTTFSLALQLAPGTHTITLVANDVCQNQSDSDTIVITYEKKVTPSPGVTVPTEVGGGEGGVRVYPDVNTPTDEPSPFFEPVVGLGRDAGKFLIDNLDLQPYQRETPAAAAARVTLAVVGVAVMMFGPVLALWHGVRGAINLAALRVAGIKLLMPVVPSRRLNLMIRGVGALLFLLSLTL